MSSEFFYNGKSVLLKTTKIEEDKNSLVELSLFIHNHDKFPEISFHFTFYNYNPKIDTFYNNDFGFNIPKKWIEGSIKGQLYLERIKEKGLFEVKCKERKHLIEEREKLREKMEKIDERLIKLIEVIDFVSILLGKDKKRMN